MVKRKANNKEYEYDVKAIFVPSQVHMELKKMSAEESTSMGSMIHNILKHYKKTI